MSKILAHRGNDSGPSHFEENQLPAIRKSLARGWGLEIDIRRANDGRFYISHDPRPSADGLLAESFCAEFRKHPHATIALNVKEYGYEAELINFLTEQHVLRQTFLFDMELVEPFPGEMAERFRGLNPTVRIAARVSDRDESIDRALGIGAASVIWLDEFDSQWSTEKDVRRLKDAGRTVYAVSPDLHKFPLARTRARWSEFRQWGVDGICTDYSALLDRVLATETDVVKSEGVTA